jgi:DNA primase
MELSNEVKHDLIEDLVAILDGAKLDGLGKNIILSSCPFCGHTGYKYGIYVGKDIGKKIFGKSNCFSCGKSFSSLEDTLKALGHEELIPKKTIELYDEDDDELHLFEDEIDDSLVEVPMPKGYKRAYKNQYLRSRGWIFDDFEFFEVGTNRGMDRKLEDYVILPVIDNGRYVGWVARHTWSKEDIDNYNERHRFQIRRYLNSTEGDGGNGFSKLLYNIDSVKKYETDTVILCEGAFDVVGLVRGLELYENHSIVPVCTFGKKISDIQIFKLQDKGVKTVVIGYDADDAGRSAINKVANELDPYFDTYVAAIPDGFGKDFGDMSKTEMYDVFANHIVTPREFYYGDK